MVAAEAEEVGEMDGRGGWCVSGGSFLREAELIRGRDDVFVTCVKLPLCLMLATALL